MEKKRVLIMGAAGRDFHNFNVCFRDNEAFEVVGFTATQIPDIEGRLYPPELAGSLYPQGIPIYPEEDLEKLIVEKDIDIAVFSYSDVSHEYVMHRASRAIAAGADFLLLGSKGTMVKSQKPVISVCAVRTGSGKSQTTRRVAEILKKLGKKTAVIRHPMPYGDLRKQVVQRFASYEDLDRHNCTIEEREEYEPHIDRGNVVYAGVDYGKILAEAEKEADVILWDGGNNDLPFYRPDLHIVVADPLRPYHEVTYHPGEANLRMADVVVINKIDSAYPEDVQIVRENIIESNPKAIIIEAVSPIVIDDGDMIRGKRVLVVEDGPTLTHGEMSFGAGVVAAQKYGAAELVDPRENAVGTIKETFEKYPQIGQLLPAVGYSDKQLRDLEETINRTQADLVVVATPIDLGRVIKINKPYVRVRYDLQEIGTPDLEEIIRKRFGW
ncbi:MAG TPA: GTPase [candidate division WOR-3 bacterium]|uniref:GTPase n=1 Tax=candidate division WOR-3 bacterium TaxID=2052148 RepID=A0A7C0X9F7_UNCW3|nr:GTPase [candidate division WOR-3 bacterium]